MLTAFFVFRARPLSLHLTTAFQSTPPSLVRYEPSPLPYHTLLPLPLPPPSFPSVARWNDLPPRSARSGKHHTVSARLIDCPREATETPDLQSQTHLPAVDLVLPNTVPLTEEGWDRVDVAVNEIDGGWSRVEKEAAKGTVSRKILVGECDAGDSGFVLTLILIPHSSPCLFSLRMSCLQPASSPRP